MLKQIFNDKKTVKIRRRAGGSGFEIPAGKNVFFTTTSRPALAPTPPRIQRVPGLKSYNINQQNTPLLKLYFNFYDVFYMFRARGFIFRKTVVRTVKV
jgi:hypothetical protein